jgi:micrococcal nuclease
MKRRSLDRRHATLVAAAAAVALLIPLGRALRGGDTAGTRVRVASVVDGDTIRVMRGARRVTIRLIGVDAPETHHPQKGAEPFGAEATAHARQMLAGGWVTLEYEDGPRLDKYGRTLAYVRLDDGTLFNEEIIRAGYARVFRRFPFRYKKAFFAAEAEARREGRGMWAGSAAPHGSVIGNRRSKIYHLPGQDHYADVSEGNRVYFETEEAARAAGYRAAKR